MSWSFPVPASGDYEVRLYFGNSYAGTSAVGQRVFDVSLEGSIPSNLDDIDLSGQLGHLVGGMFSNVVTVTDGVLDIEFLHVVENPLVNAIEIIELDGAPPAAPIVSVVDSSLSIVENNVSIQTQLQSDVVVPLGETVLVSFDIVPNGATPLIDYEYLSSTATYDASTGIYSDSVVIVGGASVSEITVNILEDLVIEPDESYTINLTGVSGNAELGTSSGLVTIRDDDGSTATPLYRVNAGGPLVNSVDGGPNWTADTAGNNSVYLSNAGSNSTAGDPSVAAGSTVPATVPSAVFASGIFSRMSYSVCGSNGIK